MSAEAFLDTNIIIYLLDDTDAAKRRRSEALIEHALEHGSGCISYQVVQESLYVTTRKLSFNTEDANRLLNRVLLPLWKVNPSGTLYRRGLDLQARYQFSSYDSLIIAAALDAGCKTLYSEDLQHGQRIDGLTIQNPFLESRLEE